MQALCRVGLVHMAPKNDRGFSSNTLLVFGRIKNHVFIDV